MIVEGHDKLCDCELCKLAYQICEFVDVLVLEKDFQRLNVHYEVPDRYQNIDTLRASILALAVGEYFYSHGIHGHHLMAAVSLAWNKRVMLFVQKADDPSQKVDEIKKKLEDYES